MRYILTAVALMSTLPASGQVAEFAVSGGQSLLQSNDIGSAGVGAGVPSYSLDDGFRLAFRLTLNNWNFFGQEFGYAYNRTHLLLAGQDQGGMAIHQGFYNLLAYATPEGSRIRPFVVGGGHFSNFVPPGSSATQGGGDTKFGVAYGGGVKVRVGEKWQVRFDLRQHLIGKPFDLPNQSGSLKLTEVSVGLGFVL